MLLILAESLLTYWRASEIRFRSPNALAIRSYPYCDGVMVAVQSGFSFERLYFPDAALETLPVPVANDSCGGSAAVVNYRNWPN